MNAKLIVWADLILVMEKRHKELLNQNFRNELAKKQIVVLGIADEYQYMDEELILEIETKVNGYL